MKTKKLWKTLLAGMRSKNGDVTWVIGEWRKVDGHLEMCEHGFHASELIQDAMNYVSPEIIAEVEVRGEHLKQSDKQCWQEMRVLRAWEWTTDDSVALALFSARSCEDTAKDYPAVKACNDLVERWQEDHDSVSVEELESAAWAAAELAWAARSAARSAAWAAARAARTAAWAARSVARSAAWAAESAAWAAESVRSARSARSAIHGWIVGRLEAKTLIGA